MEVVLALTCLAVGAASYRGHFRWWATEFAYGWYAGFTFLYLGIILLIPASFSVFGSPPQPWRGILFNFFVICCFPIMFSFFLMPTFLLPRWFIEGRAEYRHGADLYVPPGEGSGKWKRQSDNFKGGAK